jgi:hypothetical protein
MSLHESRSLLNKDRKMISGTGDTKQLSAITHSRQRVLSWRTIPGPKSVCLKVGMVYRNVLYQNKRLYPTHHCFYWKHHVLMACKITVKSGSSPNLRQALTHLMFLYVKKIYSCYFTSLCLYIEYIYIIIYIFPINWWLLQPCPQLHGRGTGAMGIDFSSLKPRISSPAKGRLVASSWKTHIVAIEEHLNLNIVSMYIHEHCILTSVVNTMS